MHSLVRLVAAALLAFPMVACGGGGSSSSLSEQQATQAFGSMQSAIVSSDLESKLEQSGSGGSVSVSANCNQGGTVSADGSWVNGQSFSLDLAFAGCVEQGITINGELSYDATGDSTHATIDVNGDISFTGTVTGSCSVNLEIVVTQTGGSVNGTICGVRVNASGSN